MIECRIEQMISGVLMTSADTCSSHTMWDYLLNLRRSARNSSPDSNHTLKFEKKRTKRGLHDPRAVCQIITLHVFFQNPFKIWAFAAKIRLEKWLPGRNVWVWEVEEKAAENANSGFCLGESDCSESDGSFTESVPGRLWMDANYHAQQCFSTIL